MLCIFYFTKGNVFFESSSIETAKFQQVKNKIIDFKNNKTSLYKTETLYQEIIKMKNAAGLPGETVQIKGSTIYIDGKPLKENYGKDPIDYAGIAEKPIKLGDDEYFVLGDNREISRDSRYEEVGKVKRKNIEGRAVLRIYPFDKFGTFR